MFVCHIILCEINFRFLYLAIQLDYSEASTHLVQSLRKAPSSAIGFRHTVHKLSTVVQLLLGNIPERQLFLQSANKEALAPYFELTKGMALISRNIFLIREKLCVFSTLCSKEFFPSKRFQL